jgi:putative ABC transport system ATP-binding protein
MSPLVVENVVKTFRQGDRSVAALDGVSLEVTPGQFLAVMGASGSGKSTLLHLMAGLTRPDAGAVVINGTELNSLNDRELTLFRRHHIGLVFQSFNLIPTLTAEENILLPLMLDGKSNGGWKATFRPEATRQREGDPIKPAEGTNGSPSSAARVGELLQTLGLTGRRTHRPDAMSGGEQQRVAIGRALVTDPAVILADEPTGNLDSTNSRSVCQLLRSLSIDHGKTIVMVTHEPSVAAYAQQVAVIKDGKLVCTFAADPTDGGAKLGARYLECIR